MSLEKTIQELRDLLNRCTHDLQKTEKGNKAAAQRVRTGTVRLEKVAKRFRKESVTEEKTGSFRKYKDAAKKGKKAAKTTKAGKSSAAVKAAPKKAAGKKKAAPKKAAPKKAAPKKAAPKKKASKAPAKKAVKRAGSKSRPKRFGW